MGLTLNTFNEKLFEMLFTSFWQLMMSVSTDRGFCQTSLYSHFTVSEGDQRFTSFMNQPTAGIMYNVIRPRICVRVALKSTAAGRRKYTKHFDLEWNIYNFLADWLEICCCYSWSPEDAFYHWTPLCKEVTWDVKVTSSDFSKPF